MHEALIKAYEMCAIGQTRWIGPDKGIDESLELFQAAVRAAELMEQNGKIVIRDLHRESQTSFRYVDRFKFERIA